MVVGEKIRRLKLGEKLNLAVGIVVVSLLVGFLTYALFGVWVLLVIITVFAVVIVRHFMEPDYDDGKKQRIKSPSHFNGPVRQFHTKIVGISQKNPDGSSRQKILSKCSVGDRLELRWDRFNKYDRNAIEVVTSDGKQLGFLSKELAKKVAPQISNGVRAFAIIKDITGGTKEKKTLGCNIEVMIVE